MNMIEKIARAIYEKEHGERTIEECRELAKAAIEAMKEPSEEMIAIADKCRFDVTVISNYKKIIEAALKDS